MIIRLPVICWLLAAVALSGHALGSRAGEQAKDRNETKRVASLGRALLANLPDPSRAVRITHDGHMKQRPCWSPDGKQLVFARHQADKITLFLLDLAGSKQQRLTGREQPEYDAAWSPDGKQLAFTHVSFAGTQGDLDVHLITVEEQGSRPLAKNMGGLSHEEWPAWSPDGKRLAFSSTRPGNQELFVVDADGANEQRLTSDPAIDAHPAWSPDGRHIVFATDRWGGRDIAVMNPDGSDVRRLTTSPRLDDYPAWSPDGELIAFVSNRDGNFELYLMLPDGAQQTNLTRSAALDTYPAWSPDGRAIAFVSAKAGRFDLYVLALQ